MGRKEKRKAGEDEEENNVVKVEDVMGKKETVK